MSKNKNSKPDHDDLSDIESFSSWPYTLSDVTGKLLATASAAGMGIALLGLLQVTGVVPHMAELPSALAQTVGMNSHHWIDFGVGAGLGWGSFFGAGIAGAVSSVLSNIDNKAAAKGAFRPLEAFNNAVYNKREDQFMNGMNKKYADPSTKLTLEDLGALCAVPDYKLGRLPLLLQTVVMKTQRDMYYNFLEHHDKRPKGDKVFDSNGDIQKQYEMYRGQRNQAGATVKRLLNEEGYNSASDYNAGFNGLAATSAFVGGVLDSGVKPFSGTAFALDILDDGKIDFSFQTKQAEAQLLIIGAGLALAASAGSIYASGKSIVDAFFTKNPNRYKLDPNELQIKNVSADIRDTYKNLKGKVTPVPGIA